MKDPVFKKLKDDAGLMLSELFLAITHRPAPGKWRDSRDNPPAPEMAMLKPVSPRQYGLWYEWRLDKAQNFLGERTATLWVRKTCAHDLPGEAAHFQQKFLDPAMLGDGFFQPIRLFL